jgi:hypothetical protein
MPKEEYHDYATDNRLLAQTYAFGPGFLDYIAKQKMAIRLRTPKNIHVL